MRNWSDVLPEDVAMRQAAWERRRQIIRANDAGMPLIAIARQLGLSQSRICQLNDRQRRLEKSGRRAPILEYFTYLDEQLRCAVRQ